MLGGHIVDVRNICWKCVTCLDVVQNREGGAVVNAVMNLNVP
jgi:hypothetical protein